MQPLRMVAARAAVGIPLALGLFACSESTSPAAPVGPVAVHVPGMVVTGPPAPVRTEFTLCKFGTDANFDLSINGGPASPVSLVDGECRLVYTNIGPADLASVTELLAPNTTLDSVHVSSIIGAVNDPSPKTRDTTLTGITGTTVKVGLEWGSVVSFYNTFTPPPPPPQGGEGCTPGYWKQTQHFDSWPAPYTQTTLFSSIFENAYPGQTLLQVLSNNGNSTGLDALGRHTVAALLNAASSGVSYDLTTADVINQFNAVYPGTKSAYVGQKDIFEKFNTQGCPLN